MKLQHYRINGFVDVEGCFGFSIFRNKGTKSGFQIQGEFTVVQHKRSIQVEFTVVQHKRSIQVLHALKDYFGCGVVAVNHGDRYHYRAFAPFFCPFGPLVCHLQGTNLQPKGQRLVKKLSDLKEMD
jgi:hypothetical protein